MIHPRILESFAELARHRICEFSVHDGNRVDAGLLPISRGTAEQLIAILSDDAKRLWLHLVEKSLVLERAMNN